MISARCGGRDWKIVLHFILAYATFLCLLEFCGNSSWSNLCLPIRSLSAQVQESQWLTLLGPSFLEQTNHQEFWTHVALPLAVHDEISHDKSWDSGKILLFAHEFWFGFRAWEVQIQLGLKIIQESF